MKIELKDLMDENEMLSHIFLGCVEHQILEKIRDSYVGIGDDAKDWRKESVKISVEMKIGGYSVNPKDFFDSWKERISGLIVEKAKELVSEKLGSAKLLEMQEKLVEYEGVLKSWEEEINWDVENPFNK